MYADNSTFNYELIPFPSQYVGIKLRKEEHCDHFKNLRNVVALHHTVYPLLYCI